MNTSHNNEPTNNNRFNTSRVDLLPYISRVEQGTFSINPSLSSSILKKLTEGVLYLPQTTIEKMWSDMKIERNALVAFITRSIMRNLEEQFSTLHSATEARLRNKTNSEPGLPLKNLFMNELAEVAHNTHKEADDAVRARTLESVQRLHDIVLFGGHFNLWETQHGLYTAQTFIFRGFNTASAFLIGFYQLLVKTYIKNGIPLTSENIQKGVLSAQQHMHLFASFDIAHGPGLIDGVQNNTAIDPFEAFSEEYFPFDAASIRFIPDMDKIRAISHPITGEKVLDRKPEDITTGCPVRFTPINFEALAVIYAKMLGTYVETMTEPEKENVEKSVRNFLVYIT